MIMRIYRADKNLEANAGVPLPAPTLNPGSANPSAKKQPPAPPSTAQRCRDSFSFATQGAPVPAYLHLRGLAPAPHPAVDPILWERFRNPSYLQKPSSRAPANRMKKPSRACRRLSTAGCTRRRPTHTSSGTPTGRSARTPKGTTSWCCTPRCRPTRPPTRRTRSTTRRVRRCATGRYAPPGRSPIRRCCRRTRRACSTRRSRPTAPVTTPSW